MVNDLRALMREASDHPPHDRGDLAALVGAGRRRVRVRRAVTAGGTALAAGAITLASMSWLDPTPADLVAAGVPRPDAPTVRLADARPVVEGTDYRTLASQVNEDLESDNGEYFDGVTDDGLVLLRAGETATSDTTYALLDPATGTQQLLDGWSAEGAAWPLELGTDRVVLQRLAQVGDDGRERAEVDILDRATGTWRTVAWPTLPATSGVPDLRIGPDGRAWAILPSDRGRDASPLWSMSLTDPTDVRDEGLEAGAFGFDGDRLVWADSLDGAAATVHVRDLDTGEEASFDPGIGERCNLLGFDVDGGRIAMTQYCGTYDDGVRDERVQVVTTEGEQVVTVQDNGVDAGRLAADGELLTLTANDRATGGTYVYDFAEGRLLRLSDGFAQWTVASGPTPDDQFLWAEPAGGRLGIFGSTGATAHLSELIR